MPSHYVLVQVLAAIPEHDRHAGHKAIVRTEDPVAAVVAELKAAGLEVIEASREIVKRTGKRTAVQPVAVVPTEE